MGCRSASCSSDLVQLHWWWVTEQGYLRSQAVRDNDPRTWESLHKHARKVRLVRGLVLLAEVLAIGVAAGCVTAFAPLAWVPMPGHPVPVLAWFGRPDDKPILTSATVPVAYETLSLEVIVRALGWLAHRPDQPGACQGPGERRRAHRPDHRATDPAGWPGSTCPTA